MRHANPAIYSVARQMLIWSFQVAVALLEHQRGTGKDRGPPTSIHTDSISVDDIRLVMRVDDDRLGSRDVVVRYMHGGEPIEERDYGVSTPKHTRYVSGLSIPIPWPESTPEEFTAEEADTPRVTVEERTYYANPMEPAFPDPKVIDELRNRYSRNRTRHDTDWVEEKVKEDAMQAWLKRRTLFTPIVEKHNADLKKRLESRTKDMEAGPSDNLLRLIREEQARTLQNVKTAATAV